jgi:hypothetical protein
LVFQSLLLLLLLLLLRFSCLFLEMSHLSESTVGLLFGAAFGLAVYLVNRSGPRGGAPSKCGPQLNPTFDGPVSRFNLNEVRVNKEQDRSAAAGRRKINLDLQVRTVKEPPLLRR